MTNSEVKKKKKKVILKPDLQIKCDVHIITGSSAVTDMNVASGGSYSYEAETREANLGLPT